MMARITCSKKYYRSHIERGKTGVSYCGKELGQRWEIDLPTNFDSDKTTIGGHNIHEVCAKAWKEDQARS